VTQASHKHVTKQNPPSPNATNTLNSGEAEQTFQVVVNDEDQHSIWPAEQEPPAGWRLAGFTGGREDCLARVDQVWTDLRPKSLRIAMESAGSAED
jgi:MbtH protein